jgi:2-succinyl-6-hydroxy-2,4-cyclohexadiene-1-carboxylate synthase
LGLPEIQGIDPFRFHAYQNLWQWASAFNDYAASCFENPVFLMGYSMGGRLALHALLQRPSIWKGAVMISTHPGLTDQTEKLKRVGSDQKWAERFEKEEWSSLMQAWNQQQVFGGHVISRMEENYNRRHLSLALSYWSLGFQEDLRERIKTLDLPMLWITGEKDLKFRSVAQTLAFNHERSKTCMISHAGHRILWEEPKQIVEELKSFLKNLV